MSTMREASTSNQSNHSFRQARKREEWGAKGNDVADDFSIQMMGLNGKRRRDVSWQHLRFIFSSQPYSWHGHATISSWQRTLWSASHPVDGADRQKLA